MKLFSLFILLVLTSRCIAQDTLVLRGQVIDGRTNEPVIFAHITLLEPYTVTQGDFDGNFYLDAIGKFKKLNSLSINIHYTGYPDLDTIIDIRHSFKRTSKKVIELKAELTTLEFDGHTILPIGPQKKLHIKKPGRQSIL